MNQPKPVSTADHFAQRAINEAFAAQLRSILAFGPVATAPEAPNAPPKRRGFFD